MVYDKSVRREDARIVAMMFATQEFEMLIRKTIKTPQGGRDMQKVQTQKSSLIINLEGYAKGRLTITAVV